MTSLSQQLQRLSVPQSSSYSGFKKLPSLLFDPKDAAEKDRKTIFDLGYQGLQELIALKSSFSQFEKTLFNETTLLVERSVENSSFNVELDKNIDKFFYHLSPYFMTRSAHMCLEWMIRRFQVHLFNKDSFIRLILPYHETNIFVKCVQILKLKNPSDVWHWLSFLQKSGLPLSKRDIINRAAKEQFLLSFVCTGVVQAVSELGGSLQCLINFYCSVIIGVLDRCGKIKEWHVSTILPSIIKGMKSDVIDYVSASFMITSVLINKQKTNMKLLNVLVVQICKVKCEQLQTAQILLLSLIFKNGHLKELPSAIFLDFISNTSLLTSLSNMDPENISIDYIVSPLFCTALDIIQQNKSEAKLCRDFIDNLVSEIKLSDYSSKLIIRLILKIFLEKKNIDNNEANVIDLESEDDYWMPKIIQSLERQYSLAFDAVVKETVINNDELYLRNELCSALRHTNFNESSSSVFQRLYHSNNEIRVTSFKELISKYNEGQIKTSEYDILKTALPELIKDDSIEVVQEILKLKTNVLVDNLECDPFTEILINILDKATLYPSTWGRLQPIVLTHLTSDIIASNCDNNLIHLVLLRYLLPTHSDEKWDEYIRIIFHSYFGEKSTLIQALKITFDKVNIKADNFKRKCLLQLMETETLCADDLVCSLQKSEYNFLTTSVNVSLFLIMLTAGLKANNEPETSRNIFTFTLKHCKYFHISHFSECQWKSGNNKNAIPLQLFIDFLQRLIETTNFTNFLNWDSNTPSLVLFVEILYFITVNAFNAQLTQNEKQLWALYLNKILHIFFPTADYKINVLSQFLLYENLNIIEDYSGLRIRVLKVLDVILNRERKDIRIDIPLILKIFLGLSSSHWGVRQSSLNILHTLYTKVESKNVQQLLESVLKKSESILHDSEQISFSLYSLLNTSSKKVVADEILEQILKIVTNISEPFVLKAKVLELLKHIRTTQILKVAVELALNVLNSINRNNSFLVLDRTTSEFFEHTVMRFDENCINDIIISDKNVWMLIEKTFKVANTFITTASGNLIPMSCITLDIFDEPLYNKLPLLYKTKFLKLIIEMISNSDYDVVFLDINRALRHCIIDCQLVLPFLNDMKNVCSNQIKTIFTTSKQWKEGVVLLEIIENKKKLLNSEFLIPILFDILKTCLDMENQSPLEYTKQLILSSILQSCKCINLEKLLESVPGNIFRIDLIVQCIRTTQNPETQFKALTLLTYSASLFPQQVLYNSLEIFTFIGSTIARHDDAFSFQVISNVLESVVPILVQSHDNAIIFDSVVPVLKVFSDILLDVPEHRRIPLYLKLLNTLGAEKYFWIFLCVVFESLTCSEEKSLQVKNNNQKLQIVSSSSEKLHTKVEMALHLLHEFNIDVALQTCFSLLIYIKTLPFYKEDVIHSVKEYNKLKYAELFNIETKSSKQFRHYKYLILQFVSTFTSSPQFIKSVSLESRSEEKSTKDLYKNLMIEILSYLPDITRVIQKRKDSRHLKFWGVLLDHCYDTLDNIILLLSPDMFLVVVCGLMDHTLLTVRKEVTRLLINKIQEKNDYFLRCSDENISNLLRSLHNLINTITVNSDGSNSLLVKTNITEPIMVQQAGLIAIKLLSNLFGIKYKEEFMNIVLLLTNIAKKRAQIPKILFATVVLTLVEVVSNLKANAISYLPKCIPHLMNALREQANFTQKHPADNVCLVLLTGIQKLVETMPLFLGPYIVDIISVLSTIWSNMQRNSAEIEHKKQQMNSLRAIWSKIATSIPSRILIPSCESAYYILMRDQAYFSVGIIMNLLLECLTELKNSELFSVQSEFSNFFLKSLGFRAEIVEIADRSISSDDISKTENEIIDAFVAWILKLSESTFRPVYQQIYDWAIRNNGPKCRVLTYFILNNRISCSLKSIFVLFAGDIVLDTKHFLCACNTNKTKDLFFESDNLNVELLKNMLSTLSNVFMYGSKGFINQYKFESLISPIVDQLENSLVLSNDELQSIVANCIGQMALSVSNFDLWKSLSYQILLKTRSDKAQVRIKAFNCCIELARTLGDDFTSLLPEIIPFVAELFEDENPEVVRNSRRVVREIELILGEPLQKYL